MNTKEKKLGEAELEIMQAIWASDRQVTSNFILNAISASRPWQLSTLMTSLTRLCEKGFIKCDRSMGANLYSAVISEDEYKTGASVSFLKKMYNSSLKNLVATLYGSKILGSADIKELRQLLDKLESEEDE